MITNDKLVLCSALKSNICISQNNSEDLIEHDGRLFIAIELINRAFNETPAVEVDMHKLIGRRVVRNEKYNNYRCPRCNGIIYESYHYCSQCGQKFDWRMIE